MKAKILVYMMLLILGNVSLAVRGQDKWFQKGMNATDPKEKIEYFTKSIEKEGADAETFNNRGLAKYYLKDFQGAVADYSKAIELDPKNATAYINRGAAKNDLQDYQ